MSDSIDLLQSVKDRTDETEFYTPFPTATGLARSSTSW